jgi:5,5'-dehydrodivanillate O-demethylase
MLTEERNRLLTQVGAGTPMGNLLRRYWMPIAALSELDDRPTRAVRLMGENLVLYRDLSGNLGLVDRHCPHRRADLMHGMAEPEGLRCSYHGWLFNNRGRCLAQPYEDVAFADGDSRERIRLTSYPVQEHAGIVWAYLGPEPVPLLPNYEPFTWKHCFAQIVFAHIPCNWFQIQENSIDPVHFEWQHSNWSIRLAGKTGPYSPRHTKLGFDEFEHGLVYRRVREDTDEDNELWTVGRVCLWPNALFTGGHFEWRVPIDDENTLSVTWMVARVPKEREPYVQNSVPYWYGPIKDARGEWITSHVMNQDFVAWVGQGTIADRTKENLGHSDRGIVMMRRRFIDDLDAIAAGRDPKAIIRDPEQNRCIELPIVGRELFRDGLTRDQLATHPLGRNVTPRSYVFQSGQPEHVRRAMAEALGHDVTLDGVVGAR